MIDVYSGLELADRVKHRKVGDDVLVELRGDVHRPAPDLRPVLRGDLLRARRVDGLEKIVAIDGGEQIAVAYAIDVDRDLRRVDSDERRALLTLAREHISPAGEMRLRRAVAHVDLVIGGCEQRLAHCRGQALAQHDRVALAMLEALDADLLFLVRDRRLRRSGHRDIGRKIGPARESFREIEADARQSGFVVDLVVENAEAVIGAHRLIGLAHIDRVVAVERGLERVERRSPLLVAREQVRQYGERRGLSVWGRRMLIGGISRRRSAGDEFVAVVRLGVVGCGGNPSIGEPVGRVLGGGGDRRACELLRVAKVGAGDGARGLGQQLLRRLAFDLRADRRRRDAQGLGQTHGVARHVLAREGLGLGGGGAPGKQDQKDGERAQSVKHGFASQARYEAPQRRKSSTVEAPSTKADLGKLLEMAQAQRRL